MNREGYKHVLSYMCLLTNLYTQLTNLLHIINQLSLLFIDFIYLFMIVH